MWALLWLVWPRATHPREPEGKDMDCVDSRIKFKNRAGESPAATQLHAKDQTLPFRLPAPWRVISSYPAFPFHQ